MANIKSFKGVTPAKNLVEQVAALPYDVYTSAEARDVVKGNDLSFLKIDRAEVYFEEGTSPYEEKVYAKAKEMFYKMISDGVYEVSDEENFYIYELVMSGRSQVGLVACASVDDYENNIIKKHENTRYEKEVDRINHVDSLNANTGPIFLTYKNKDKINKVIEDYRKTNSPFFDFTSDDGVTHRGWRINDKDIITELIHLFDAVDYLYIADGHHRAASGVKVGKKRREENPNYDGSEEFNYFLSVIFPDDQLFILPYNRVVKDLNGLSKEDFLHKVKESFDVSKVEDKYQPESRHDIGMYLDGEWYKMTAKDGTFDEGDVVASLDVSILQDNLLSRILGIDNPKVDNRIDFIGGIRGLGEIERRCAKDCVVGFSMYPTSIEELISIADAGLLMPPKSTWFEPKLRSGLFMHLLS